MIYHRILIFIFIIVISSVAFAENIHIRGKVRNADNEPVEFATVRVVGSYLGTTSDINGSYSLTVSSCDTLRISFTCVGYKSVEHIFISPKNDQTVNVKLYPVDYYLSEIRVSGNETSLNGMANIDVALLGASPDVSGGSLESLLTIMPGVNSSNELSNRYSVRGGSFDENSVYINGVELSRPQLIRSGEQEGMSIINPYLVESVRFSSGGFPARYSDKMSSALDVTYKRPKTFETSVELSLMGGSLAFGTNYKDFSMIHGLRYKNNNSLLTSLDAKGEYDPSFFDYQTNFSWYMGSRWSANLLGNISINRYKFVPKDRITSFGTSNDMKRFKVFFDGKENDIFETYFGALSFNYRQSSSSVFSLLLSTFRTGEKVSYDISGEYWLNEAGSSSDGQSGPGVGIGKYMEHTRNRLNTTVLSAAVKGLMNVGINHFSYGLNYSHESFRDRSKEWEWRDSAGYSLPILPDGVNLIYNLTSNQDLSYDRISIYGEDALYFDTSYAHMALNVGLRASYCGFNREYLLSPRINVSISPEGRNYVTYRAAAGVYYQSPFYKEFREIVVDDLGNGKVVLNKNIRSPKSIHFLLGTDYQFQVLNRPFKITGELYYKLLSDLISYEYDNLKVTYSGLNDSKGYIAGLDFRLFGQFVPGSDSWISVSLMKTNQTLYGKKVPLPSDQRYSFGLFFTDYFPKIPKLRFSLRGIFSDGLTMTAPRTTRDEAYFRAPSYKRVDVGLVYFLIEERKKGVYKRDFKRHIKSLSFGVDVFNLFDISNVSSYYWVSDVNNLQYAVPNYLTRRQINFRISAEF